MSQTAPPTPPKITTQVVVLVAIVALLVVVLILGLVYLGGPDGRSDVLNWLSGLGALVASVLSGIVAAQVRRVGANVAKIDEQTNGILTQRIREGVAQTFADHGLLPMRRADDGGRFDDGESMGDHPDAPV